MSFLSSCNNFFKDVYVIFKAALIILRSSKQHAILGRRCSTPLRTEELVGCYIDELYVLVMAVVASLSLPGEQDQNITLVLPHFLVVFRHFFSRFLHFIPHFGIPAGRLSRPGRPWLRH